MATVPAVRRIAVPLAVALALLGCSGSDDDDEGGGTDATVADVTATTPTTDPAGAGPAVDVLDDGAEPRARLRMAFAEGAVATFRSTTTIDQSVGGASPGPITTTFDVTTEVLSVEGGRARIRATYADPDVEAAPTAAPDVVAGAERGAALLDGAVAELTVDERGHITDATFEPGADAGPVGESIIDALLSNLSKLGVVLPDEPVGVGARWVLRSTVDTQGVVTATEQTYTVVAVEPGAVELAFTVAGTFSGGSEGTTTGSGTVRLSFDSFLADTDATTANVMTAQGTEVTQDVTQSVRRTG